MGILELFLIGIGLSMDAFAVAVCKGLGMRRIDGRQTLVIALFFGGFQALMPAAAAAPYGASKAGVVNLSRSLAGELAVHHIRVLSYIPGVICTPMADEWMNETDQIQNIPSSRYGRPEDLANALVFLASPRAEYINGVHVDITGGKFCVQNPRYSFV